ncbi:helix-turn-helix domain-containing protein [Paenibacillus sp. P25]|nr:helix-turn-helix domain-containing protein [Paenibacillus sp. P25]
MALAEQSQYTRRSHMVIGLELMNTDRISNLTLTDWSLFRFALANIIREPLAEDWPDSDFIELHSHHGAVVFHIDPAMPEEEALRRIHAVAERITECIHLYLKLVVRIGFGGIKKSWRDISDSTEEAFLDLLQQTMKLEHGGQPMLAAEKAFTIRPIKFYQELAEAITYSKEEATNRVIDDYVAQLEHIWGQGTVTPAYLQYLCRELWTILAYSLYSTGVVLDELFPETALTEELAAVQTPDDLRRWLQSKIRVIASSRGWNENSKHKEAVDFMIQYAHEHYAEEINLEDLSKELYLSRNYLNQIFKKATGETFTNYVIRLRMEKAKALLIEGKYMIYEIAERVGYKTVPYFSSVFKKYYGMNPSELGKK